MFEHKTKTFPQTRAPRNVGNVEDVPSPDVGTTLVKSILRSQTDPVDGQVLVVALDEDIAVYNNLALQATNLRHGRLDWRVGRRIQTADFDIKAGGSVFTVTADYAEVSVVRQFDANLAGDLRYHASISLAYGVPSLSPATRTAGVTVPAGQTSPAARIPHKACAVRLTGPFGNSASLQVLDGTGTTVGWSVMAAATVTPSFGLPLPNGAVAWTITNQAGLGAPFSAIFDLAF